MVLISRRARDVGLCLVCVVLFTTAFRILRPRNNRARILAATPTPAPPHQPPPLLLASATGLSLAEIVQFLKGARAAGPPALQIIVFAETEHTTKALQSVAQQWNASLAPRTSTGPAGAGAAAWRFADFARWLGAYERTVAAAAAPGATWVLMVDARNITVQRSAFAASLPPRAAANAFARSARVLGSDAAAVRQVQACAGRGAAEKWANETLLSSAAVLASLPAARAYASLMSETLARTHTERRGEGGAACTEEAAHMALAFNGSIPQLRLWPHDNPILFTLDVAADAQRNAAGELTTPKGLVPCLVALR